MTDALNPVFTEQPRSPLIDSLPDPRVGGPVLLMSLALTGLIVTAGMRATGRLANRGLALGTATSLTALVAGALIWKPTPLMKEGYRISEVVRKGGKQTDKLHPTLAAKLANKPVVFEGTPYAAEAIHRIRMGALFELQKEAQEAKDTESFIIHKARIAYFEGLAPQPTNQDSWQTRFSALKQAYGDDWKQKIATATGPQLRTQMWK